MKRRSALAAISATALAPLAAGTAPAHATPLGPTDITDLESAIHTYSAQYSAQPPHTLRTAVAAHRRHARTLLRERRHTPRQDRELAHHAGMLTVTAAWIAHDHGHRPLVQQLCDEARELADRARAPQVAAWAEDVRATDALYAGHPRHALTAITRGLATAPRDSHPAIRLTAQLARVHARLGNRDAFTEAAAAAHRHRAALPLHGAGLFAVDAVRIISYDASSHLWLGDHERARTAATEAITHYQATPGPTRAPTRLAIAQLDLATAQTALGEPEAAVATARQALTGDRTVQSVRGRARQLDAHLHRHHPGLPLVRDFTEEVRALGV
ncbi:tetratricopeptide repeat protein [Streptomyces sp. CAU 1734]|uniref:tetratricopeptide repeat protein n=1 Tax=Streptomyces sp. CAU 1734 TaxID=3140360 RepID=UPI00325FFAD2